jgi:hypothetical protein
MLAPALRAVALVLLAGGLIGCSVEIDEEPVAEDEQALSSAWYTGAFAELLSEGSGDIRQLIIGLPLDATYTNLDERAEARVEVMFDAIYAALDRSLASPCGATTAERWKTARSAAFAAGYYLRRYYDVIHRRWFLVGKANRQPGKPRGLAYFIVNPEPGRNIVLEVPHKGVDRNTEIEGAHLFTALAARAILVNGAERCASSTPTSCHAGPTRTCGGSYRMSDVSHNDDNAFFALHAAFDRRHKARFFQIHQNTSSGTDAIISDGTSARSNSASPSHKFYEALRRRVPNASVRGCQSGYSELCGLQNQQGKMTNTQSTNVCTLPIAKSSKTYRFLHFEQSSTMADATCTGGKCWEPVRDALLATWGWAKVYNDGRLGAAQSATPRTCR